MSPAIIGTAVPHDHQGNRLAVAIGATVIDPGVAAASSFSIARTLDRTFASDTPASGGGNVSPDTFMYQDDQWEIWQVVPFLGAAVSPVETGDCRIHIRDRSIERDQMQLADMPDRIVLSKETGQSADWQRLPWTFNRPTSAAKFTSPGSGNAARRSVDYEPVRQHLANAATEGIAQGETFTITLHWD